MSARRCNAKCYNARGPDCHCPCNGVNHGVGKEQAHDNARKIGLIWKTTTYPNRHRKAHRVVVSEQGHLFAPNLGSTVVNNVLDRIHITDKEHE
jgi:hypothetical protein